jgi:hypothetical protein
MLNVIMLIVVMLNVVMLSVFILSVVAPYFALFTYAKFFGKNLPQNTRDSHRGCTYFDYLGQHGSSRNNITAHIKHQCRKTTVLRCHRCLMKTGVKKMNNI